MKALLVVAHGSRREASNEEVRRLCRRMAEMEEGDFGLVQAAFLELAEPSIPDGIGKCVAAGASEVVVLPYFLSAGRHVSEDIPALVEQARRSHPGTAIRMAPYLGAAAGVAGLMMGLALAQNGEKLC